MKNAIILLAAVAFSLPARASECCTGDLGEADGVVEAFDLAILLGSWGPCAPKGECPADLNGDGVVAAFDLAILLGNWGSCNFDYGAPLDNAEAQQIGLEMLGPSGPLLVPAEDYLRIDRDLGLIRDAEPGLVGQLHSPAWVPNQLLVSLVDGAPQQEYLCLNVFYQVTDVEHLFGSWYVLTFTGNLNVVALAQIYEGAPAVQFAEPNFMIGGQNFWVPTPLSGGVWRWDIDDGWHDCFDGCDCHRLYVFRTDAEGNVALISFEEVGAPWCDFGG